MLTLTLREVLDQIIHEGRGERLMSDGAMNWFADELLEALADDDEALNQPVYYDGHTIRRVNEDTVIESGEPMFRFVEEAH